MLFHKLNQFLKTPEVKELRMFRTGGGVRVALIVLNDGTIEAHGFTIDEALKKLEASLSVGDYMENIEMTGTLTPSSTLDSKILEGCDVKITFYEILDDFIAICDNNFERYKIPEKVMKIMRTGKPVSYTWVSPRGFTYLSETKDGKTIETKCVSRPRNCNEDPFIWKTELASSDGSFYVAGHNLF